MPALPLEFVDCVIDAPQFRENLIDHEKQIDNMSKDLKSTINLVTKYIDAFKQLKQVQCDLANSVRQCPLSQNTKFTFPDSAATDDEIRIQHSLVLFYDILVENGEAIDRLIECCSLALLEPLKKFREERLGLAKESRKKFERQTGKYCQSLEKYLGMKSKGGSIESEQSMEKERQNFHESSMNHVMMIQEVEEESRLRIVEAFVCLSKLLAAFYFSAQEALSGKMDNVDGVMGAVQMAQDRFEHFKTSSNELMEKTLKKPSESIVSLTNGFFARQGYLFMLIRKPMTTVWTKHFCQYNKEGKQLLMLPYVQTSSPKVHTSDQLRFKLVACVRRANDTIDRRFCFDITVDDRNSPITLQAMSEEDMRLWLDVMDGKEPTYATPAPSRSKSEIEETSLNEEGYLFLETCIREIERRGFDEEGLYRLSGSTAKLSKFIQYAQARKPKSKHEKGLRHLRLDNTDDYDTKLLTSAVKKYLRLLNEPLMTFDLHDKFISAAKQKDQEKRIETVGNLIKSLPANNRRVLTLLIHHFRKIAAYSATNKMTPANLGIVIGPSIFRSAEESVAAIMDIKFAGVVVQVMVEHCDHFFPDPPVSVMDSPLVSSDSFSGQSAPLRGLRSQSIDAVMSTSASAEPTPASSSTSSNTPSSSGIGGFLTRQLSSKWRRSVRSRNSFRSRDNDVDNGEVFTPGGTLETIKERRSHVWPPVSHSGMKKSLSLRSSPASPPVAGGGGDQGGGTGGGGGGANINSNASSSSNNNSNINNSSSGGGGMSSNSPNLLSPRSPTAKSGQSPVMERAFGGSGLRKSGRSLAARFSHPLSRSDRTNPAQPMAMNGNGRLQKKFGKMVRTKYRCVGEQDNELSFEPNRIVSNVRQSEEEGWLIGILDGKEGLIPENYVEFLN